MKILHICTMDWGGAGKAALRLHLGLKSIGVESKMLVLHHKSSDSDVMQFKQYNSNIFRRAWNRTRNKLSFLELNAYQHTRLREYDAFSNTRTLYNISASPLFKEADIINLHWIADMLDYDEFFLKVSDKPIAWTLHDMNPFTGGCHYSSGCSKYETGCVTCLQLGSKKQDDLSKKIFKRKEKAYKGHHLHIVSPSEWLKDSAKKSLLFRKFKIEGIPYGVPTSVFKPQDKKLSRDLLYLPQDKTLILFGASYKTERKRF